MRPRPPPSRPRPRPRTRPRTRSTGTGTVTTTKAGTYRLHGTLTELQVVVDAGDTGVVRLVLDGVNITSSTTSELTILNADSAVVILAEGSTNSLTDGTGYVTADNGTATETARRRPRPPRCSPPPTSRSAAPAH